MKRLLLLCDDFLPVVGGVSMMMHHLANAIVEQGIDVLVAPPPRPGGEAIGMQARYRTLDEEREAWVPSSDTWYRRPFEDRRLYGRLRGLLRRSPVDAILMGDQAFHAVYDRITLRARSEFGLVAGVYCHGLDIRHRLLRERARPRELLGDLAGTFTGFSSDRKRVREMLRRVDCLFANSRYTAGLAQRFAGRAALVTGCGIDEGDWNRETELVPGYQPGVKQRWRRELGWTESPTVGFLGRLVATKNVELLLRSLPELPGVRAVIVGAGPNAGELVRLAGTLGVGSRVHWLGRQDEATKWKCLRALDVLCLPTKEADDGDVEGFGIVLLEAAAAGTPVVAARAGGMTDVVQDERSGLLCDPADPRSAAGALRRLLEDEELARACVARARDQIRERFNWKTIAGLVTRDLERARAARSRSGPQGA